MPDFPQPQKSSGWDIALPAILGLVAGALPGLGRGVNAGLGVAQMMQKRKDDQLEDQRSEFKFNSTRDSMSELAKQAAERELPDDWSHKDVPTIQYLAVPQFGNGIKSVIQANTPGDTGTADTRVGEPNTTQVMLPSFYSRPAPESGYARDLATTAGMFARSGDFEAAGKALGDSHRIYWGGAGRQDKELTERQLLDQSFNEVMGGTRPRPGQSISVKNSRGAQGNWSGPTETTQRQDGGQLQIEEFGVNGVPGKFIVHRDGSKTRLGDVVQKPGRGASKSEVKEKVRPANVKVVEEVFDKDGVDVKKWVVKVNELTVSDAFDSSLEASQWYQQQLAAQNLNGPVQPSASDGGKIPIPSGLSPAGIAFEIARRKSP